MVQDLPAAAKAKGQQQPAVKAIPANSPAPEFQISQNFRQVKAGGLALSIPENWKPASNEESRQITILPEGGVIDGGGIGAGILIGTFQPKQARTGEEAHNELLQNLNQQNQGQMQAQAAPQATQVSGRSALLSRMVSPSPYQKDKEHDYVVSVPVQNQLLYFIFIGPESRWSQLGPVYGKVLQSVRIGGQ
jgi:hypothetical protein